MQRTSEASEKNSILIVDDSKANIITLNNILSKDYNIMAAKTGVQGLELAFNQLPDLILLDIIMPEMDGFEVLKQLRENDGTRGIPVIFISGLDTQEDEEKGLLLGAADYISKPFSSAIVKLRVASQLKILKQINTIETLSMTDTLTQIPNRRGMELNMEMEWNKACTDRSPIAILMIDIDNFKNINDAYGHIYGDIVLRHVAITIKGSLLRVSDTVARWGGEEFIVMLPGTSLEGAIKVGETICQRIRETGRRDSDKNIKEKVTVSIGAFSKIPDYDETIIKFIESADEALYRAKNNGKDQVKV